MENFKTGRKRNSKLLINLMLIALIIVACKPGEPITYTSIAGAWKCTEMSIKGSRTYPVDIYPKKTSCEYSLSNFHNIGFEGDLDISCTTNGLTVTLIPIENSRIRLKNGTGTVNTNFTRLQMEYLVFDGTNDVRYSVVYTR